MTPEPKAPASDLDAAVGRLRHTARQLAWTDNKSSLDADLRWQDLSLILDGLADANVEIIGLRADVEAAHAIGRSMIAARDAALSSQSQAAVKPGTGDLWWNPGNEEMGFTCFADAFEDANEDGEDYSVELHRGRILPPVWGALLWIDGKQKIQVFATEAEADEARRISRTLGDRHVA